MRAFLTLIISLFALPCIAQQPLFPFSATEFTERLNTSRKAVSFDAVSIEKDSETPTKTNYSYLLAKHAVITIEEGKPDPKVLVVTVGFEMSELMSENLKGAAQIIVVMRAISPSLSIDGGTRLTQKMLGEVVASGYSERRLKGSNVRCVKTGHFICIFRPIR